MYKIENYWNLYNKYKWISFNLQILVIYLTYELFIGKTRHSEFIFNYYSILADSYIFDIIVSLINTINIYFFI